MLRLRVTTGALPSAQANLHVTSQPREEGALPADRRPAERHTASARLLRDSSAATQQCALAAPYGPPNEAPRRKGPPCTRFCGPPL